MNQSRSRLRRWTVEAKRDGSKAKFFRYKCEAVSQEIAETRASNALKTIWAITTLTPRPFPSDLKFYATPAGRSRRRCWTTCRSYLVIAPAMLKMMQRFHKPRLEMRETDELLRALVLRGPTDPASGVVGATACYGSWDCEPWSKYLSYCVVSKADGNRRTTPPVYLEAVIILHYATNLNGHFSHWPLKDRASASATLRAAAEASFTSRCSELRSKALNFLREHDGEWLAKDLEACHGRQATVKGNASRP